MHTCAYCTCQVVTRSSPCQCFSHLDNTTQHFKTLKQCFCWIGNVCLLARTRGQTDLTMWTTQGNTFFYCCHYILQYTHGLTEIIADSKRIQVKCLPDSWFSCFRYNGSTLKAPIMSALLFTLLIDVDKENFSTKYKKSIDPYILQLEFTLQGSVSLCSSQTAVYIYVGPDS